MTSELRMQDPDGPLEAPCCPGNWLIGSRLESVWVSCGVCGWRWHSQAVPQVAALRAAYAPAAQPVQFPSQRPASSANPVQLRIVA